MIERFCESVTFYTHPYEKRFHSFQTHGMAGAIARICVTRLDDNIKTNAVRQKKTSVIDRIDLHVFYGAEKKNLLLYRKYRKVFTRTRYLIDLLNDRIDRTYRVA